MVRDASRRLKKYQAKIVGDVIKNRIDALKDDMVTAATDKFADLVDKETATKNLLADWGVSTVQVPFYLSYARELYGILLKHSGNIAQKEAEIACAKWKTRGLDPYYLQQIASVVFGLDVSAAT